VKEISRHSMSDEDILETYDRLASKWAQKMEARLTQRKLAVRHPRLVITFERPAIPVRR
jgi:hypothetical protein